MKKLLCLLFVCASTLVSAQISQTIINKDNFEKSDFPYKGDRVLMVEKISGANEENMFVFAKNKKGEEQDRLYIQQYTKENDKWELKVSKEVADEGIVTATQNNRKAFNDVEKDGLVDALFIYTRNNKGDMDNPIEIIGLLFHKYQLYWVSSKASSSFVEDQYSPNFKELPKAVQEYVLDYWRKLDKK
ncbi:MAG: hypothetical protein ACRCVU_19120 [Flavobacterium sp.]